jgi:branched-chain amino acid transport system substrate-binding protein
MWRLEVTMARKLKTTLLLVTIAALFAVPFLSSCSTGPATPAGAVKIGIAYSTGGPGGKLGGELLDGARLARDYYNKELGGINVAGRKYTIEFIELNSNSNPQEGVSVIKRLMEVEKVPFIIGDCLSNVVLAQAPVIEEAKWPWIMNAANPALTTSGYKYVNRCNFHDNLTKDDFWKGAMATLKGKNKVAILAIANDFGKSKQATAKEMVPKYGGTIVLEDNFAPGASDFYPILTKLKGLGPDAVYMPNYGEVATAAKQAKEVGLNVTWFIDDTVAPPEIAKNLGDAMIGMRILSTRNPVATTDDGKVYNRYITQAKGPESIYVASYGLGWDAAIRAFKSFEKAGTVDDRVKLAAAIREVVWDGADTIGKFDASGQIGIAAYVLEVTDGKGTCKVVAAKGALV